MSGRHPCSSWEAATVPWKHIRISRFGGPEVLELVEETDVPDPGPGEVRVKVLAAGTGFTDSFIRRGRYPDFKGPLPFIPGYDIVGIVERTGPDVTAVREGEMVADLCVVGGYTQYAVRPARLLVPVPDGLDPAGAVSIPLGYLTAFQMLVRYRHLPSGATILVIGASGTVGTALLDLARHFGLKAIGTCSAATRPSSRVSGPRQSIIEPKISSRPCIVSPAGARAGPAWMPRSTPSAALIFPVPSPVWRKVVCWSAMGRRPWRLGAKVWRRRPSVWLAYNCGVRLAFCSTTAARFSTASPPDD
jgi:hypothetical protein